MFFLLIVRLKWYERIKVAVKTLPKLVLDMVLNLNVFALRDFDNSMDRTTAKRYGQWATRLHFALLIIGLVILVIYTIIQPHSVTMSFEKPSYTMHNDLKQKYGDKLTCPCSSISSSLVRFVHIEAAFYEVRNVCYSVLHNFKCSSVGFSAVCSSDLDIQ